jgi:MFS family permease
VKDAGIDKSKEYKTGGWSAHFILIVCTLLYVINYMDRQVFSVILQPMKVELGLTDAQCGLAITAMMLCMGLFAFPISHTVDRWSRKGSIGIMALLWSGFTFATGLARSFVGVLIPRAFVGLGEAGFAPGGVVIVSAAYPPQSRGRVLGIFHIAIPLGAAAGVMLGGLVSAKFGWRTPFYYFAIPGILLGILAFFMKDYKTAEVEGAATGLKGFGKSFINVWKVPTMRWLWLALGLSVFMSVSVMIWLPSLLMRIQHIDEAAAGMIVGLMGLSAIIGAPLGGFVADYWQKRNPRGRIFVPAVSFFIGAVGIVVMVALKLSPLGIAFGVLANIASAMAVPAFAACGQDIVPVAHRGLAGGLSILAQYALGGAWGPYVIGSISDALGGGADGLSIAMMLSTIVGILGVICFLMASRTYPADSGKVCNEVIMAA